MNEWHDNENRPWYFWRVALEVLGELVGGLLELGLGLFDGL